MPTSQTSVIQKSPEQHKGLLAVLIEPLNVKTYIHSKMKPDKTGSLAISLTATVKLTSPVFDHYADAQERMVRYCD